MKKFLAILLGATTLWAVVFLILGAGSFTLVGCGSDSYGTPPGRVGDCDTTRIGGQWQTIIIECTETETLYVSITDTLYIGPDYDCFTDCLEVQGLGHWEDCIRACIPIN